MARGKRVLRPTRGGIKLGSSAAIYNSPIATARKGRSRFNLSRDIKTTAMFGEIQPVLLQEIIPDDKFDIDVIHKLDFQPTIAPIKHLVNTCFHAFFVPKRILWSKYEKFKTGSKNNTFNTPEPTITLDNTNAGDLSVFTTNSLLDYFGLSPVSWRLAVPPTTAVTINALPLRAYDLIWRYFYTDMDLTEDDGFGFECIGGSPFKDNDVVTDDEKDILVNLKHRCWDIDYFQFARPSPQMGGNVYIPSHSQDSPTGATGVFNAEQYDEYAQLVLLDDETSTSASTTEKVIGIQDQRTGADVPLRLMLGTIRDLEYNYRLQEFLIRNNRAGYGYWQQLKARYGVHVPLEVLDKPIYLGSSVSQVETDTIYQTSESNGTPQGNLAGRSMSMGSEKFVNAEFKEEGYLIVLMSIMPQPAYMHSAQRLWFKGADRLDYYTPEFDAIGDMAIYPNEVQFGQQVNSGESLYNVFGFVPPYFDYRTAISECHGDFRSSLKYWHMGRDVPQSGGEFLNHDFIECNPETDEALSRIFAIDPSTVQENPLVAHIYFKITASRPMSYYAEFLNCNGRKGM